MGKDLEGSGYDLVEKLSRKSPEGAKENHENSPGQPIPGADSGRYGFGGLPLRQPRLNPEVPA
jgi:hypothetical protein